MTRLTEKKQNNFYVAKIHNIDECVDKLGKLEDIEEELGIDLSLLLKVLKNGFYYKIWGNNIGDVEPGDINISIRNLFNEIYIVIQELAFENTVTKEFYFDDYGKTWALTENELKEVVSK